MPQADLKTVSLHYELSGPPDAPVLMFSNSLGTNLDMWTPQLSAFERDYRVLRYDMRGHGQSSVPTGPYSIQQLSADALGLLDHLGFDRVHFCGLSIGGMTGQWLAANVPERLNRLALCNTAAKIGTEATWNSRIEAVEAGGLNAIADGVMERWFTASYRAGQVDVLTRMRAMLCATNVTGYVASCAAIRDMDQRATAASISVPTLLIAGEFDPVTTVADSQYLEAHIAGARLAVIPASHISNVEASDEFNAALQKFLADGTHDR